MARKKPADPAQQMFDLLYEDGSRSSNRKVNTAEIDVYDRDASIRRLLEAQDDKVAEMSGRPRGPIKTITPSDK
jgi:hypothetical protein